MHKTILCILAAWWLVCSHLSGQSLNVAVETKLSTPKLQAGNKTALEFYFNVGKEWHIYAANPDASIPVISLQITPHPNDKFVFSPVVYPPALEKVLFEEKYRLYEGKFKATVAVEPKRDTVAGNYNLEFVVQYQGCTDTFCSPPVTDRRIVVPVEVDQSTAAKEPQAKVEPNATRPNPPQRNEPVRAPAPSSGNAGQSGLLWLFLVVFLGGFVTSLTPCVYPMIPVTVSYFAKQSQSKSRAKIFGLAVVFVMGVATLYTAVGVVTALLKQNFNVLLQSPWVIGGIAALFLLLGLSFLGLFSLRMPSFIVKRARVNQSGAAGAFGRGLVLGIVAAPCMGPATIAILPLVPDQPFLGGVLLFTYAWGIGIPFIVLAMSTSFLPKAGNWLHGVEIALGCLIIMVGLVFLEMLISLQALAIVVGCLLLLFSAYLLWETRNLPRIVIATVCVLLAVVLLGGFFWKVQNITVPEYLLSKALFYTTGGIDWEKDYNKAMTLAQEQKRPLMIDVWAKWCGSCRVMDNTVLKDTQVVLQLRRFVNIKLDITFANTTQDAILKKHNVLGPPTYVFYDSQGNWLQEKTIPGSASTETFLKTLQSIR